MSFLAYFGISGVPDLQDRQLATLLGASFETRYMLMDRHHGPFGFTIIAEPRWDRVDANSGASLTSYGGPFTVVADKELINNRLFGALNVLYDAQTTRFPLPNLWVNESKIGFSSALSARITPTLFLGGEVRYLRANDGLGFRTSAVCWSDQGSIS
jgi:hypothetical protein